MAVAKKAEPPAWVQGLFVEDLYAPQILYAVIIRSPADRGTLISLDIPPLPRDYFSFLPSEIPGENRLRLFSRSMALLSDREIGHRGQPLALLAGPDLKVVKYFAQQIGFTIEKRTPLSAGEKEEETQKILESYISEGVVENKFKESYQVLEERYTTFPQEELSGDILGAFAKPEEDNSFLILTKSPWIFHLRDTAAEALKLPPKQIRVRIPETGSPIESRIWYPSLLGTFAALLAWKSGRPVKLLLSRQEELENSFRRSPVSIKYKTGLDTEGNIKTTSISISLDTGAFPMQSEEHLAILSKASLGTYKAEAFSLSSQALLTSNPPPDPVSGFGPAEALFALETHVSRIAELCQRDPISWRRDNLRNPEKVQDLLDTIARQSDFYRKYAAFESIRKKRKEKPDFARPLRGIGIALASASTPFFSKEKAYHSYSVTVRLEQEERLFIATSSLTGNRGTPRFWKRMAGEILGIPLERITIVKPDTALVPDSGPSLFSRNTTVTTELIKRGCEAVKRNRFREPLPIEITRSFRFPSTSRAGVDPTIATNLGESWAAGIVEIEVDPITYIPVVKGVWLTLDCGKLLDKENALKRMEAGIYRALSWSLARRYPFEDFINTTVITGINPITPVYINFLAPKEREEPAGIGELPFNVIPSAVITALSQATGRHYNTMPVTPSLISRSLEEQ